jgi:undecaprenyl-diphosphatase
MTSPHLDAALLGVVQGVTEFLPVSSDGHLAIAQRCLGMREGGLALNVALHAGTLIATGVVLWRPLSAAIREGVLALGRPARFRETPGGRDAWFVLLATAPTAVIGLALKHRVEAWTDSPLAVAVGLLLTTALLVSTRWARPGEREVPSAIGALALGVAQGLAVAPGLSRSGATLCVALWLGVRPGRAFELSMICSVPAVLGAVILEVPDLLSGPAGVGPAALGAAVAIAVGIPALLLLRGVVDRGRLAWFGLWTATVALASFSLAGPA